MKDKTQIPGDHPIREIWELNKLNFNGLIQLAKEGDKDAARLLLVRYVDIKRQEEAEKERGVTPLGKNDYRLAIEQYILDSIKETLKTNDANKGFNLKRKSKTKAPASFKAKRNQCDIAYKIARLIDEGLANDYAYEIIAKEVSLSKRTVIGYYKKYMKI